MNIKVWLQAIRAPFFSATIVPVFFGSVLAWSNIGTFSWSKFFLVIIGALFLHAGTNLVNDYFDHLSGCDEANKTPTQFSGGSRTIQDGLLKPRAVLFVSLACFSIGSIIGLYLNHIIAGNVILFIGIIGVLVAFFYTKVLIKLGFAGIGETACGIGFGPLIIMGAYYVQAQILLFNVFLTSIPIGIFVMTILLINEFPDYEADKSVEKKTLVVMLGKKKAIKLYSFMMVFAYIMMLALIVSGLLPFYCSIVFFSIPIAVKAIKILGKNFDNISELMPANAATIALHSISGFLLCAGIYVHKMVSI